MATQSLYQKAIESQTFSSQAEAVEWAKKKKAEYKAAGETLKHEIVPVDATRRRWKATLYLKV
jgi:hypothetical protein